MIYSWLPELESHALRFARCHRASALWSPGRKRLGRSPHAGRIPTPSSSNCAQKHTKCPHSGGHFVWLPELDSNQQPTRYTKSSCFHVAWTISSSCKTGARRIVSEPSRVRGLGCGLPHQMTGSSRGFPQLTLCFNHLYRWKLQYACVNLSVAIGAKEYALLKFRLNPSPCIRIPLGRDTK